MTRIFACDSSIYGVKSQGPTAQGHGDEECYVLLSLQELHFIINVSFLTIGFTSWYAKGR
jgi:hypothetical protein